MHDLFDEVIVRDARESASEVIFTTWHPDEPIDEVLWQATIIGCEAFDQAGPAVVVALLEGDARIEEVRKIGRSLPKSLDAVVDRK